jgi:hypothetical protein
MVQAGKIPATFNPVAKAVGNKKEQKTKNRTKEQR